MERALDLLLIERGPARPIGRPSPGGPGVGAARVGAGVEELGGDEDDAVVHVGRHEPKEQHLRDARKDTMNRLRYTEFCETTGCRLCDPGSCPPLFTGASSRNLGPLLFQSTIELKFEITFCRAIVGNGKMEYFSENRECIVISFLH